MSITEAAHAARLAARPGSRPHEPVARCLPLIAAGTAAAYAAAGDRVSTLFTPSLRFSVVCTDHSDPSDTTMFRHPPDREQIATRAERGDQCTAANL